MNTFKFDTKTGRFETLSVNFLSKRDLTALKAIAKKGYGNQSVFEAAFPRIEGDENERYQPFYDITWKLKEMGLIVWKNDEEVPISIDLKDYRNNKYEHVAGDFLTPIGKAVCQSMGFKLKRYY